MRRPHSARAKCPNHTDHDFSVSGVIVFWIHTTAPPARLDSVAASESAILPTGAIQPFGVTWKYLIEQENRAAALGCYRAATMLALKRALRNGSVSVGHSIAYRQREERLIPQNLWERDRA